MSIPAPPTDPPTPSWLKQVYTTLRYLGTGAGTLGTIVALIGVMSPDSAHAIVTQLQLVFADLTRLFGDSWKLALLVIPVVTVWLGRIGVKSSSDKSQIKAVQAIPTAQVVTTDKSLADSIPGVIHAAVLPTK